MTVALTSPVRLSDLYDADRRTSDPAVRRLAEQMDIPHPLTNVAYADGVRPCTHARRHDGPGCTETPFTKKG